MKKILVPCDFSFTAHQAYRFALDLGRKTGGEVLVVHAIDIPIMFEPQSVDVVPLLTPATLKRLEENAREKFDAMRASHDQGVRVTFTTDLSPVLLCIQNATEKNGIDLVVMGTNGTTGLTGYLIGSNAEKAVRFSKVPVLVVRKYKPLSSVQNIVLPTTLGLNQVDFMQHVRALQATLGARLWLLAIEKPGASAAHRTHDLLHDFRKHYQLENCELKVREAESIEGGIAAFVDEIQADMIVMGTHARKGLAHLFSGSVTEDIVNHIDCPIWTYTLKRN